ncbi:transposase [Paracoccus ravus]|uniref:transposase n=1 Tax=Paracoccus ravus TaxID=2447760 RepID=UPI001FD6A1F2|nr:transposase [Paracoccus ravus]
MSIVISLDFSVHFRRDHSARASRIDLCEQPVRVEGHVLDQWCDAFQVMGLPRQEYEIEQVPERIADRAFDANWVRETLAGAGIEPVIPPKSNRRFPAAFDRETYKWRHLIENFFGKLKEFRGIATRSCKTDSSFFAFIAIAATVIRLR